MAHTDEVRLMTKLARMYYEQGMKQQDITERLNLHQSTVSRLLKRARESNIVRISVAVPTGIFPQLEADLEARFNLKEAIVVDTTMQDEQGVKDLGAAAAFFLETNVKPGMVIGISAWSRSLFAMMASLHQNELGRGGKVVQILGGVGNLGAQQQASQLAIDLASRIGATPVMLQAPGVVASAEAKAVLARDPAVREASRLFPKMDLALVGIGSMTPSPLLASSGNIFSLEERRRLAARKAVGDICLRFFDEKGVPVRSSLMERVIGIELEVIKRARQRVGIAGGRAKLDAIRAALLGNWINILVTDRTTAEELAR